MSIELMCCIKKIIVFGKRKGSRSNVDVCWRSMLKMFQLNIVVINVRETFLPVLMLFVVLTCIFPDINELTWFGFNIYSQIFCKLVTNSSFFFWWRDGNKKILNIGSNWNRHIKWHLFSYTGSLFKVKWIFNEDIFQ